MSKNGTKHYYDTHAQEYFLSTYELDLESNWEKLKSRLNANATILDFGCGSGRDVRHFSKQGFRIVGLDNSFNLLKLAKNFSHAPLVLGDICFPPFQDHTFDAVWASASLLHISRHSVNSVLAQIHRVLKLQGVLLTSMKQGQGETFDNLGRYNVFYQQDEWTTILKNNDFEVIEAEEDIEIRITESGGKKKIVWSVCVARATNCR